MASNTITISVDALLSKTLSAFAKEFYEEHGVQVDAIYFDWVESPAIATYAHPAKSVLVSTRVETTFNSPGR